VKPFKRIGSVIARPSRGRYPWLARVFTIGQGLRPDQVAFSKCAIRNFQGTTHDLLWNACGGGRSCEYIYIYFKEKLLTVS
jgi:hypothetical protein